MDGLLISRPSVGDGTQPPLPQQGLHLLEPSEIMRGVDGLVVLGTELGPMRRRKRIEDRSRIVTRIMWPGGFHRLGGHALNLQ